MRLRRHKVETNMGSSLMLTPMLDVLTVVLIFLILNFAPEQKQLSFSEDIRVPKATAELSQIPQLKIEITRGGLQVNGEILPGLYPQTADASQWEMLKAKMMPLLESAKEGLLLVADAETEYDAIDKTVARLASLGFSNIYLVTQAEDQK